MSITAGLPRIQEKANQKSFHQRHNSGELDVFEAAGYFSGSNEINGTSFTPQPKMMRASGRMSLDIPVMSSKRSSIPAPTHHQKVIKDEKKFKQPNSPGGKLASFLNSLFNQTSSKTKKSKISSSQLMKDDQDHEIGRRKRRSSISHFGSVNTTSSNFISSDLSFEKRPPCVKVPTKNSSKEIHSHSDQNHDVMMNTSSKKKYSPAAAAATPALPYHHPHQQQHHHLQAAALPYYGYSPSYIAADHGNYNHKLGYTSGSYMNGHYSQVYLGQPMMGTANTLMPMYPFYHFQQTQAMGLPAHYYSPTATATITTGPALMSKPTSIPPNPVCLTAE